MQVIATAATALALAGCSSGPPPYQPGPGNLVAGTAQVTVNGQDAGTTDAVQCTTLGTLTMIRTGDDASGVTAMVSNKDQLKAASVAIRDLGGFTGSYSAGVGDDTAKVRMTGRTYDISGTADGFDTDNPSFRNPGPSPSKCPASRVSAHHTAGDDPPILTGRDNTKENSGEAWVRGRRGRLGDRHRRICPGVRQG